MERIFLNNKFYALNLFILILLSSCRLTPNGVKNINSSGGLTGSVVSGNVFEDSNYSGPGNDIDPSDLGLKGIPLKMDCTDVDGTVDSYTTNTDLNGFYEFSSIPVQNGQSENCCIEVDTAALPSGYNLIFDVDGLATANKACLDLPSETTKSDQNFGYEAPPPTLSLAGTTFYDPDPSDGKKEGEPDDSGFPNVDVSLSCDDGVNPVYTATTTTDANGDYSFSGIPPTMDGSTSGCTVTVDRADYPDWCSTDSYEHGGGTPDQIAGVNAWATGQTNFPDVDFGCYAKPPEIVLKDPATSGSGDCSPVFTVNDNSGTPTNGFAVGDVLSLHKNDNTCGAGSAIAGSTHTVTGATAGSTYDFAPVSPDQPFTTNVTYYAQVDYGANGGPKLCSQLSTSAQSSVYQCTPSLTVSGYVFRDKKPLDGENYDEGTDDSPITNVDLEINCSDGTTTYGPFTDTTDADGYYEFTGIPSGMDGSIPGCKVKVKDRDQYPDDCMIDSFETDMVQVVNAGGAYNNESGPVTTWPTDNHYKHVDFGCFKPELRVRVSEAVVVDPKHPVPEFFWDLYDPETNETVAEQPNQVRHDFTVTCDDAGTFGPFNVGASTHEVGNEVTHSITSLVSTLDRDEEDSCELTVRAFNINESSAPVVLTGTWPFIGDRPPESCVKKDACQVRIVTPSINESLTSGANIDVEGFCYYNYFDKTTSNVTVGGTGDDVAGAQTVPCERDLFSPYGGAFKATVSVNRTTNGKNFISAAQDCPWGEDTVNHSVGSRTGGNYKAVPDPKAWTAVQVQAPDTCQVAITGPDFLDLPTLPTNVGPAHQPTNRFMHHSGLTGANALQVNCTAGMTVSIEGDIDLVSSAPLSKPCPAGGTTSFDVTFTDSGLALRDKMKLVKVKQTNGTTEFCSDSRHFEKRFCSNENLDFSTTKRFATIQSSSPYNKGFCTIEQANSIDHYNSFSSNYYQLGSIDAIETCNSFSWGLGKDIGRGVLGNQYVIKDFCINEPTKDDVGFLGKGTILYSGIGSMNFENANIVGRDNVGIVAYQALGSNISVTGSIKGRSKVGGFLGSAGRASGGFYSQCNMVGADVEGTGSYVGGVIGKIENPRNSNAFAGNISFSYVSGKVVGNNDVGGFAGFADKHQALGINNSNIKTSIEGNDNIAPVFGRFSVSGKSGGGTGVLSKNLLTTSSVKASGNNTGGIVGLVEGDLSTTSANQDTEIRNTILLNTTSVPIASSTSGVVVGDYGTLGPQTGSGVSVYYSENNLLLNTDWTTAQETDETKFESDAPTVHPVYGASLWDGWVEQAGETPRLRDQPNSRY